MSHDVAVPLQLQVSKGLRQRLKIAAALNHVTLRNFTVALIEQGLNQEEADRYSLLTDLYSNQIAEEITPQAEDLILP